MQRGSLVWRLCIVVWLGGCGRLVFDAHSDPNGGDASGGGSSGESATDAAVHDVQLASPDATGLRCMRDDFTAGLGPYWQTWSSTSGFAATVVNGLLEVQLAANRDGAAGILTAQPGDLTGARVTIEVPATTADANTAMTFRIAANQGFYSITYSAGRMLMLRRTSSGDAQVFVTYSPVLHRFWRIAHDAFDGSVRTYASSDGSSWTNLSAMTDLVPLTNVQILLEANSYGGGAATPDTARFDNFELCVP